MCAEHSYSSGDLIVMEPDKAAWTFGHLKSKTKILVDYKNKTLHSVRISPKYSILELNSTQFKPNTSNDVSEPT